MFGLPYYKLADLVNFPKQATIYPGSFVHDVAKFMLTHRMTCKGNVWHTNVTELVKKHGRKAVLQAINQLRRRYKLQIIKSSNSKYDRPNVWKIVNPERVRFHVPKDQP